MKKMIILVAVLFFATTGVWSQSYSNTRIPLIGEDAPSFTAQSTNGIVNFPSDFGMKWKILFSHPADFTPVCTSEIMELALMQQEFKDINVELLVVSTDELTLHESWLKSMDGMLYKEGNPVKIEFPLVDDSKLDISMKYGMITPSVDMRKTVRAVFIINPQNKIAAIFYYPKNVGRNLYEIKRTVIALQTAQKYAVLTPVNWKIGDDVLLPYPYPFTVNDSIQRADAGFHNISWYMMYKKPDK